MKRRNILKLLPLSGTIPFFGFRLTENPPTTGCATTSDIEGPFYIADAPATTSLAPIGAAGEVCFITGTVYYNDCTTPIKNALVDVWHANDGGGYEDDHYRGRVWTDDGGNYSFRTILPGKYLNGNQFRPRHFHYKVSKDGNNELTTQIYFEGDTSIPIDPWASNESAAERIIPLTVDDYENLHGVANIALNIAAPMTTGIEEGVNETPKRSHILNVVPNPFRANGVVEFFVKNPSEISLECYALNGKMVKKIIDKKYFTSGLKSIEIDTNNALDLKMPSGLYILRLLENDVPTDAKRFVLL